MVADYEARKALIKRDAELAAQKIGGKADLSDSLLEEVASLVEWPVVLTAKFEEIPGGAGGSAGVHHEGRPEVFPGV